MELVQIVLTCGAWNGIMAIALAAMQRRWKRTDDKDGSIKALVSAQKVVMVDRVRYLGRGYIQRGEITLEDKETLQEMYTAYKALGGNGHLTTIMTTVDKLPVVAEYRKE